MVVDQIFFSVQGYLTEQLQLNTSCAMIQVTKVTELIGGRGGNDENYPFHSALTSVAAPHTSM